MVERRPSAHDDDGGDHRGHRAAPHVALDARTGGVLAITAVPVVIDGAPSTVTARGLTAPFGAAGALTGCAVVAASARSAGSGVATRTASFASIAAMSASIDGKRASRVFSRARAMTCPTRGSSVGTSSPTGGAFAVSTAAKSAGALGAFAHGSLPASTSNAITPHAN